LVPIESGLKLDRSIAPYKYRLFIGFPFFDYSRIFRQSYGQRPLQ
jgi:hypothetical protein